MNSSFFLFIESSKCENDIESTFGNIDHNFFFFLKTLLKRFFFPEKLGIFFSVFISCSFSKWKSIKMQVHV